MPRQKISDKLAKAVDYFPIGEIEETNDIIVAKTNDIIIDNSSDITSDINSYINSDIVNIIKKKDKYTDIHERKTYYIEKVLLKKIDKLCERNNLDKSYVINEALRLLFNTIEKV